MAFVMHNKMF